MQYYENQCKVSMNWNSIDGTKPLIEDPSSIQLQFDSDRQQLHVWDLTYTIKSIKYFSEYSK